MSIHANRSRARKVIGNIFEKNIEHLAEQAFWYRVADYFTYI